MTRSEKENKHIPARLNLQNLKISPSQTGAANENGNGGGGGNSTSGKQDDTPASRGMVIFSVLFYLVAALVMVMANKWVLNSVPVPLFFLFIQLVIAVLLLHVSAVFGYFNIPRVHLSTCKGLLPLVSINVTGLIFNTYCLQYVDASFYQVARGLVLPFTVLFSYLLLSSKSSKALLSAVGIVCFGFFLGVSSQHVHASPVGTLLGIFSSLTTSVHAIVVKKSLGVVKGSTMDLVYYNNLLSAALLSPLVFLSGESDTVMRMIGEGGAPWRTFMLGAIITGVFGFLICIAGFLSIKVTSPTTHMISSAVRGVIQTFLGKWCFGDVITAGRGFGIFFILAGSTLYTYVKDREQNAKEAIASHGKDSSQAMPSSSSSISPTSYRNSTIDEKPLGISSAHNSPVLSSCSAFEGPAYDPHSRSSTLNLGINIGLANGSSPISGIPSPRTPRSFLERRHQVQQIQHQQYLRPVSPPDELSNISTGSFFSPPDVRQTNTIHEQSPGRRLSYDSRNVEIAGASAHGTPTRQPSQTNGRSISPNESGTRSHHLSNGSRSASQNHNTSYSATDLQDILVASNHNAIRHKEAKVF